MAEVKKFIRSFLVVAGIIYLMDLSIGTGLKKMYQNQRSGYLYRSTYAIDSTTAGFLVIGSSRANHHYDSKIFEDELNAVFYNCGRDGQNVIYSCALSSAIIQRYKPKLIILDVLPNEFTTRDEDRLSSLLPYHDNEAIKSYLKYYGPFENIKLISQIYPYNSLLTSLLTGISEKNKKRSEDYHGYTKLEGTMPDAPLVEFSEPGKVDSIKLKVFQDMLARLDLEGIPVLVVFSPMYFKYKPTTSAEICSRLCSQYKTIRFLNFASDSAFRESRFFKDNNHLNETGAKLFSEELVRNIQTLIR